MEKPCWIVNPGLLRFLQPIILTSGGRLYTDSRYSEKPSSETNGTHAVNVIMCLHTNILHYALELGGRRVHVSFMLNRRGVFWSPNLLTNQKSSYTADSQSCIAHLSEAHFKDSVWYHVIVNTVCSICSLIWQARSYVSQIHGVLFHMYVWERAHRKFWRWLDKCSGQSDFWVGKSATLLDNTWHVSAPRS